MQSRVLDAVVGVFRSCANPSRHRRTTAVAIAALTAIVTASATHAATISIYGGPGFLQNTGNGYKSPVLLIAGGSNPTPRLINNNGLATGWADKFVSNGNLGNRGLLWDSAGNVLELTPLGLPANNIGANRANAINASGQIVGHVNKYDGGFYAGGPAVRWSSSGAVQELQRLPSPSPQEHSSEAVSINNAGQAVGWSGVFNGSTPQGSRAVRWDAAGNISVLGHIGVSSGGTQGRATFINEAGQVSGYMDKYVAGNHMGERAVRWDSSGNPLELADLGNNAGNTISRAYAINASGQVAGYADKYVSGSNKGNRPVMWDSSGAIIELQNLGEGGGITTGQADGINDAGQLIGYLYKYVGGVNKGLRPARWNSSGVITELQMLGANSTGFAEGRAVDINELGITVGYVNRYTAGFSLIGRRAVYWDAAGNVVDLNDVIAPGTGWTLTEARGINDDGLIVGIGNFDPDGPGGAPAYTRMFMMNPVPEPAGLTVLMAAGLLRRRRRSAR